MAKKGPIPKLAFRRETTPHNLQPPQELNSDGLSVWETIVPILEAEQRLGSLDLGVLASYCCSLGEWHQCSRIINREGLTLDTYFADGRLKSSVKRPEIEIRNSAANNIRYLAQELGLSPAARARMNVQEKPAAAEDEVGAWERKHGKAKP